MPIGTVNLKTVCKNPDKHYNMKSNSKMKLKLILFCLVGLAYGRQIDRDSGCGM